MKILITAGPTREYLDPVRFLSNPASGTLGYLIAGKAVSRGHQAVLVTGPTSLEIPPGVKSVQVESALEMKQAVLKNFPAVSALVMTAAVSDWRPKQRHNCKLKRKSAWNLPLVPNPDILKAVSGLKRKDQTVIGFSLETDCLQENALRKLKEKKLDLIVANEISYIGPGRKRGRVYLLHPDGKREDCTGFSKARLADFLLKKLEKFAQKKNSGA